MIQDIRLTIATTVYVIDVLFQIDKKTGKPKLWIYKDKMTGRPKGEATVTYDDPETANAAIQWFSGKCGVLQYLESTDIKMPEENVVT